MNTVTKSIHFLKFSVWYSRRPSAFEITKSAKVSEGYSIQASAAYARTLDSSVGSRPAISITLFLRDYSAYSAAWGKHE
jgi:hypothetical protein